jgi:hypothetical protein
MGGGDLNSSSQTATTMAADRFESLPVELRFLALSLPFARVPLSAFGKGGMTRHTGRSVGDVQQRALAHQFYSSCPRNARHAIPACQASSRLACRDIYERPVAKTLGFGPIKLQLQLVKQRGERNDEITVE